MSEDLGTKEAQNLTPMMKQWTDLRALAGDSLLFFRLGDFYELFEDDAVRAAPVMGVTLTSRNSKAAEGSRQALCGVPIGNFEIYLHRLLDAGFSVAMADQTEEPKPGKQIVRREIVQWFTPGIRLLESDSNQNAYYFAVVSGEPNKWAVSACDIATGHSLLESGNSIEALHDFLERWGISDLRIPHKSSFEVSTKFQKFYSPNPVREREKEWILDCYSLTSWEDQPAKQKDELQALSEMVRILREMHPQKRVRIDQPQTENHRVWMNAATRYHLHLFHPKEGSLFSFLDECKTSIGRRLLKFRLGSVTSDAEEISKRQKQIAFFKENSFKRKKVRELLGEVLDLERLFRKRRSPATLWSIVKSLRAGVRVSEEIEVLGSPVISKLLDDLEPKVQKSDSSDLGWITSGTSSELDELRSLKENTQVILNELEEKFRSEFKIPNLKLKMHQVFGLVAEVTALHKDKIPAHAKIVQTLANAQRFKTPNLLELEEKLLSVESRIAHVEGALIQEIFDELQKSEREISRWSKNLSEVDWSQALAEVSIKHSWSTPKRIQNEQRVRLENAVHPLVNDHFVPLDISLREKELQIMLLTGPNMAGKSTVMRLTALSALLHQMGSDVPAKFAEISLFDRIGCRMGAADDLTTGKSTFFMEVKEVASLIEGAGKRSLLLFDEIGRGTSTYDGMSLAWAITEHVHDRECLSIIATHYLELSELESTLPHLKNFHLGVEERQGKLIFTRKLCAGPASKSYGLQVAKLAELPESIIRRANEKLREFETPDKAKGKRFPLFDWKDKRNVRTVEV